MLLLRATHRFVSSGPLPSAGGKGEERERKGRREGERGTERERGARGRRGRGEEEARERGTLLSVLVAALREAPVHAVVLVDVPPVLLQRLRAHEGHRQAFSAVC